MAAYSTSAFTVTMPYPVVAYPTSELTVTMPSGETVACIGGSYESCSTAIGAEVVACSAGIDAICFAAMSRLDRSTSTASTTSSKTTSAPLRRREISVVTQIVATIPVYCRGPMLMPACTTTIVTPSTTIPVATASRSQQPIARTLAPSPPLNLIDPDQDGEDDDEDDMLVLTPAPTMDTSSRKGPSGRTPMGYITPEQSSRASATAPKTTPRTANESSSVALTFTTVCVLLVALGCAIALMA